MAGSRHRRSVNCVCAMALLTYARIPIWPVGCASRKPCTPETAAPHPTHSTLRIFLMVEFKTSKGTFTAQLFDKQAPISAENFLRYVDDGYFVGTVFHRVIPGFMIQGGGLTADMKNKGGQHAPIKNEATNGLKNKRGTLSMARTNDINSATSQFFISVVDNDFLDHKPGNYGYAVFGRDASGMEVIDAIAAVKTGNKGGHQDVPLEPITIESVTRIADTE